MTNSRCFHRRGFLSVCELTLKLSALAPQRCSAFFASLSNGDRNARLRDVELTSETANGAPVVEFLVEGKERKRCGRHAVIEVIGNPSPAIFGRPVDD